MKKIMYLLFVSTLLFSCGVQEENSENFETLSGQILEENQGEENTQENLQSEEGEQTPEQGESSSPSSPQEEATATGTLETETQSSVDAQSEEEMVEDFNAELEDIFKLIESDDVQ